MANKIQELYNHIVNEVKKNGHLEHKIQSHIGSLITQAYHQSMASNEGFCHKFNLPILQVNQIFKFVNLDPIDVEQKFRADWKYPSAKTKMYSDKLLSL